MANNVKYTDQTWGVSTPISGQQLSVNGYYTGEQLGTPTQGKNETEANADAFYVEHNTIRYGTIMQDSDTSANMPSVTPQDSNSSEGTSSVTPDGQ